MKLNEMIVIDLPSLQSIQLGYAALYGKDDSTSSIILRSIYIILEYNTYLDLPKLKSICNPAGRCFERYRSLTLESI